MRIRLDAMSMRLWAMCLPFVIVAAASAAGICLWRATELASERARERAQGCLGLVAQALDPYFKHWDPDGIVSFMSAVKQSDGMLSQLRLCDKQGAILYDSTGADQGSTAPDWTSCGTEVVVRDVTTPDGFPALRATAPVYAAGELAGNIQMLFSLQSVVEERDAAASWVLCAGSLTLAAAALACWAFGLSLSRTLTRLAEMAKQMGQRNFKVRSAVQAGGDVGSLAAAMDQAAGELTAAFKKSKEELATLEERLTVRTQSFEKQLAEMQAVTK